VAKQSAKGATRKATRSVLATGTGQRIGVWLRRLLASCLVLLLLVVVAGSARHLQQMPIERVAVSGSLQQVTPEQIQAMVTASLQGGFLGADLDSIRVPLEQLPWVHRVVVKRHWPNQLEIIVTEQLPIARWGDRAFVNHEGEVFAPASVPQLPELPLLFGPAGSQFTLMRLYMFMHEELQSLHLQVSELSMNQRGGLRARLSDDSELLFGSDRLEAKLMRYLSFYRSQLAQSEGTVQRVDLRYESGLAVAWRNG
jgi:cell division protein FtsQ